MGKHLTKTGIAGYGLLLARKHICMVVLLCTVYGSGEWHGVCHGGGLGQRQQYH